MLDGLFERYGELESHYLHVIQLLLKTQIFLEDNLTSGNLISRMKKTTEKQFYANYMKMSNELLFYLTRLHYDYQALSKPALPNEETD